MKDKVQKIRNEVEKLQNELIQEREKGFGSDVDDACISELENVLTYIDSLQEEHVKDRLTFKAIPRLLEMIEPTDRAKAYVTKLADTLEVEGYSTDAKIVRESLKIMNGEKVAMATMDEEPVSEKLEEAAKHYLYSNILYDDVYVGNPTDKDCIEMFKAGAQWQKTKDESTTEDLGEYLYELSKQFPEVSFAKMSRIGVRVAKWQKEHSLKSADGDDLPEIDREVISLLNNGKVVYAHRPSSYWDGKNIITGKVTRYYPKTYDNGGWNIPDVKYWIDVKLPKEIKL